MISEKKMFVNGEWREGKITYDLKSPYSGEVVAKIAFSTKEDVLEAVDSAKKATAKMKALTALERSNILEKVARLFEEQFEECAQILTQENAKPLKAARGEILRTIETYKFAAEEAKRLTGETIPMDAAKGGKGKFGYTVREPLGIIGAITPFNFPMNLVAHKVGPAIAAGNTIVLKPASQTPLSAFFLAELLEEAGIPKGALNVVTGSGKVVGDRLVTSSKVSMITFTGSPEVGISIQGKAGLKKVTLELGSNAGVIIDKGADIHKTASRCVFGAFSNQGQVCISLQRIYVHEAIYNEFVEAFIKETEKLTCGDPLDDKTDISALISSSDTERSLKWIHQAEADGAKIVAGGETINSVLKPTVLLSVKAHSSVSCQEVFAPIVLINPVPTVDEGIAAINDSKYGLQAGVYTNNVNTAFRAIKKLKVGGVIINDIPTFRVDHMPYGGVKESGKGREGVKYSVEEMLELKLAVWNTTE